MDVVHIPSNIMQASKYVPGAQPRLHFHPKASPILHSVLYQVCVCVPQGILVPAHTRPDRIQGDAPMCCQVYKYTSALTL